MVEMVSSACSAVCSRLLFAVALCLLVPTVIPSSILAVFPTVSKSHFDAFRPLLLALASRGHEIIVINSFPQIHSIENYTDISLKGLDKIHLNDVAFSDLFNIPATYFDNHYYLLIKIPEYEHLFLHSDVQNILFSKRHFDLVITELWNTDVFLGFAYKFNAPVIVMSSCTILPWANDRFGNPDNPAFIPNMFFDNTGHMDFQRRLINSLQLVVSKFMYKYIFDYQSNIVARKGFGSTLPPLDAISQNTSLMLVNTHHTLHGSRPYSPQVVEIGGIHVSEARALQQDLDRWMNESTHGVVYFSFGSMLRGATLPVDKVQAFLQVFRLLPQRILWKWEDDAIEGLPNNVKVMKWLPQRDVLAHPNVKAFISHGGLLGTTEAVVSGVPILGIPMYGDQPNNVAALVENGVAVHVDYNNISVASLAYALNALLNDKSYRENAAQLARRFLDRPMSPLDTAVYWTEYVIRHGGAPHLRSAAVSLAWYQYYLLDVVAVCLAALLVFIAMIYYSLRTFLRILCTAKPTKLKSN